MKKGFRCFAHCAVGTLLFCFAALAARAQPSYVGRYDGYAGFTDIDSPALGLNQQGFHTQLGVNLTRWLSLGADYSVATGSEVLTTNELPAALQAQVNGAQQHYIAAGLLPPNYRLAVRTDAATQTFAFGPQLAYRHFSRLTLFLRPSLGALRERAIPHPSDPFQTVVVLQLAPQGHKTDWTGFYGFGGGGDLGITRHIALRAQMDVVHDHPFDDILANGRWTFRYSIGPSFRFGRNIAAPGKGN